MFLGLVLSMFSVSVFSFYLCFCSWGSWTSKVRNYWCVEPTWCDWSPSSCLLSCGPTGSHDEWRQPTHIPQRVAATCLPKIREQFFFSFQYSVSRKTIFLLWILSPITYFLVWKKMVFSVHTASAFYWWWMWIQCQKSLEYNMLIKRAERCYATGIELPLQLWHIEL